MRPSERIDDGEVPPGASPHSDGWHAWLGLPVLVLALAWYLVGLGRVWDWIIDKMRGEKKR